MDKPLQGTQMDFMLQELLKGGIINIADLRQKWFEQTGQWSDLQIRLLSNKFGYKIETGNARANQTLVHNPELKRGEYRLCK